jgi:hypothetical protein
MDKASELLDRAREATSLADFGEETFREGLDVLLASLAAEAHLNERGRFAFDAQIVDLLSWRLWIERCYAEHPEIEDEEITRPLIGLGLPRTGSTALSCMLAEDPAVRSIRNWENYAPCPPPEKASELTDPRIEIARQKGEARDRMFPRMKSMVPTSPTAPSECQVFMGYEFKSLLFVAMAQVPSYSDWLVHKADLVPTYRYVKRVLKLLQWHCPPKRWRLKNPAHMLFIEDLDKVFPDARFWMTHRGIESVIPSVTDLYLELIAPLTDDLDRTYLSRINVENWEMGLRRLIAFRERGNESRFFDIRFSEFQKDPYPGIEALYRFLGETLTDEARARMEAWRLATPREKHGAHSYDPSAFGIDIAALKDRFGFYARRFLQDGR